jgi:hypothetical protein
VICDQDLASQSYAYHAGTISPVCPIKFCQDLPPSSSAEHQGLCPAKSAPRIHAQENAVNAPSAAKSENVI